MKNKEILVSVYCLSYNHEKYIRQCLDGFVMQKTKFKFEVIVHDDASTDNSARIIKEYEEKYSDIIKPIYQNENQHSQGVKITDIFIMPRCRGKYIAICEGDDYWTDENKLQLQVDYMQDHEECTICCHGLSIIKEDGTFIENRIPCYGNILMTQTIMFDNMPQTATLMYRKKDFLERPNFFKETDIGDYPLMLYMSTQGEFYCINKIMSCYRSGSIGSWSELTLKDTNKFKKHTQIMKVFLNQFDEYTNNKFSKVINLKKQRYNYDLSKIEKNTFKILTNKYFQNEVSFREKVHIVFQSASPILYVKTRKLIGRLKHGE